MAFSRELREDPVAFIRKFCIDTMGRPADPHDGQIAIIQGMGHHTVVAAGRQFGKSLLLAWYLTWFLVCHPNREVLIVAPALDQAKVIFRSLARQFQAGRPLSVLLGDKIKNSPFPYMMLVNGSHATARGANSPQYLRGHSPHVVIIDEAAFVKDGTIREVEPLMTVTGKEEHSGIIMISTPFGAGEFKDYYDAASFEPGSYYRRHHFTSLDNPHRDQRFLDKVVAMYGEDSYLWRTEYMAEFVDGEMQVISESDIKAALEAWPYYDEYGNEVFPKACQVDHRYAMGVDLANTSDYFVSTLLDVTNPSLCPLVHMRRLQNKGYDFYKETIRADWRSYNHPNTLIDATTLADVFVTDLKDISAQGYKFTGSTAKYEAVQSLVKMFSEKRIAIPNDRDIINELRYFTYSITPSKRLKMEAKRGHDDIVMSLALAAVLAAVPNDIGFFMPIELAPKPAPRRKEAEYIDPWAADFADGWETNAITR